MQEDKLTLEHIEILITLVNERVKRVTKKINALKELHTVESIKGADKDLKQIVELFSGLIGEDKMEDSYNEFRENSIKVEERHLKELVTLHDKLYLMKSEL